MNEIPVYLITGFLDSGKTTFINGILEEGFASGVSTVLISCEEGETEYSKVSKHFTEIVDVENEEDFTPNFCNGIEKNYKPQQILIECNGMWMLDSILDNVPGNWLVYQVLTFVEASTFEPYSRNFGQLMMEKIKFADMLVFNRCTDVLKEQLRSRNLRMVNRQAQIFLEDMNENAEDYYTGDECYFDLDQPLIDIPDEDYGLWFVDIMDHPERYRDKKVHLKLCMCRSKQFPGVYCPGRFAMVCCAEDVTFLGMMATGDLEEYKDREWIEVTATCQVVKHRAYNTGDGPCLAIEEVKRCEKPDPDLISF